MSTTMKKLSSIIALISVIVLSACSAGQQAQPTIDANAVYTQAAATVQSQLTQTAEAMPTATATVAPTETPKVIPTTTLAPTSMVGMVTLTPGNLPAQPGQATLPATGGLDAATPTKVLGVLPTAGPGNGQKAGDYASFAYNVPADGKSFSKGESFLLALGLSNSGSTTWSATYQMVFIGGQAVCREVAIPLGKTVKPGEKGEFDFGCSAPTEAGKYVSRWKLKNASGLYVGGSEIYFQYTVQ
jgi:hypothetical protein